MVDTGNYVITTDQIDAAWQKCVAKRHSGYDHLLAEGNGGLLILKILGIKRCEGCGGSGRSRGFATDDGSAIECPSCKGHGWRKE